MERVPNRHGGAPATSAAWTTEKSLGMDALEQITIGAIDGQGRHSRTPPAKSVRGAPGNPGADRVPFETPGKPALPVLWSVAHV
jgi:hypothetical protein